MCRTVHTISLTLLVTVERLYECMNNVQVCCMMFADCHRRSINQHLQHESDHGYKINILLAKLANPVKAKSFNHRQLPPNMTDNRDIYFSGDDLDDQSQQSIRPWLASQLITLSCNACRPH